MSSASGAETTSSSLFGSTGGGPNPERKATNAAASDAQAAAWERDRRVKVIRRNLKYPSDWPDTPAREKGVDVALAVDFVRISMLKECDVAILFSVDADLLPALEVAFRDTEPSTEIAAWSSRAAAPKPLWFPEYLAQDRRLPYCHFLHEADWDACRDHTPYV